MLSRSPTSPSQRYRVKHTVTVSNLDSLDFYHFWKHLEQSKYTTQQNESNDLIKKQLQVADMFVPPS